jgi:hypothetical protein
LLEGLQPLGLAMVICDGIHVDPATGKRTLLGTFTACFAAIFPATVAAMAVYVALTECRGEFSARLQIVDANEEREPVTVMEGQFASDDPLTVLELDFGLQHVTFPEPGEYRVQLLADGQHVMERRLTAALVPSDGDEA